MARVLLIRHCQTTGQSLDSPLTELGRRQAVALASWLAGRGIDRIVSSPYRRALDTIAPFAEEAELGVEVDERLGERRVGEYLESPEQWRQLMPGLFADRERKLPGGESGVELTARSWPALREALDGPNAVTAVIGHGQMNTHLLSSIDPSFGYEGWMAMTTPDVFEVWQGEDGSLSFRRLWQD